LNAVDGWLAEASRNRERVLLAALIATGLRLPAQIAAEVDAIA
jgi:hypothetical protein